MVFIYPDMRTVLVGKFKDGVMLEGRPSKITAERCNGGIKEILVSPPRSTDPVFSFKRNTRLRIHNATIMDPFEKNTVYVNVTMHGAGEGLFAKRNIDAYEVVAYYTGTVWTAEEHISELSPSNQTGYFRYESYLLLLTYLSYLVSIELFNIKSIS